MNDRDAAVGLSNEPRSIYEFMNHMEKEPARERVSSDLAGLVDRFLTNSRQEAEAMRVCLDAGDHAGLARLAHSCRGAGAGYGFKGLARIGLGIESAAAVGDLEAARHLLDHMHLYLDSVQIEFVDEH